MSRPIKKVAAGSRVFFRIEVRDMSDAAQPLFSPVNDPTVELRRPNGAVVVDFATMTANAIGIWTYTHQTDINDLLGVYRIQFRIVDGADIDYTIPQDAFELV